MQVLRRGFGREREEEQTLIDESHPPDLARLLLGVLLINADLVYPKEFLRIGSQRHVQGLGETGRDFHFFPVAEQGGGGGGIAPCVGEGGVLRGRLLRVVFAVEIDFV